MTEPFVMLSKSLLRASCLSLTAKNVLAVLVDHRNPKTNQCNPKIGTLAAEVNISQRAVRRSLAELRECGFIVSQKHGQRGDSYSLAPVSDCPKLIGLKKSRLVKSGRVRPVKFGRSDPLASLYELDQRNYKKNCSAVVGAVRNVSSSPRQPKSPAATPPSKSVSKNGPGNPDPVGQLAAKLVDELLRAHSKPGQAEKARRCAEDVLRESTNLEESAAAIRTHHAAWLAYWKELPGGSFIPYLDLWFSNGYYAYPPSQAAVEAAKKPAASQRRKSRLEEMLDNA
jgi:hypothetical protein